MIPRYSRKEISKIWEPKNKYQIWLDIEILICEALNKYGKIPDSSLDGGSPSATKNRASKISRFFKMGRFPSAEARKWSLQNSYFFFPREFFFWKPR